MNPALLQSQFDRLSHNPGNTRLLKQVAVEFGSAVVRSRPESLRHYRVAAATALRAIEETKPETPELMYARGVLSALLDAAVCAEETLTAEREREEVRSVASRPLHRQILRSLSGRALTTKVLAEQFDRHKSQVSAALHDLEEIGLVRTVERHPQASQKEKPYRLTLSGVTILDELPEDERTASDASRPSEASPDGVAWDELGSSGFSIPLSDDLFNNNRIATVKALLALSFTLITETQNNTNPVRRNTSNRQRGTTQSFVGNSHRGLGGYEARFTSQSAGRRAISDRLIEEVQ